MLPSYLSVCANDLLVEMKCIAFPNLFIIQNILKNKMINHVNWHLSDKISNWHVLE